jgi:hypothetical protein
MLNISTHAGGALIDRSQLHPDCGKLLDYWLSLHPPQKLPGRQHLEPTDIAPLLPHIRLVEVHRTPLRFRYRLLGTHVDSVHGRSLKGQWLDEAYADDAQGVTLIADYREVVEVAAPTWRRGRPRVLPDPNCAELEVLRLPLAADGRTVDMILAISLYFDRAGQLLKPVSSPLSRY